MPGSCLAAASLTKALNLSFSSQDTKNLKDAKEDCRPGDNCTIEILSRRPTYFC